MATDTRALDPPPNVGLIDQFTWREPGSRTTEHGWPSNFFIEPDGTNVEAEFQLAKIKSAGKLNPFTRKALLAQFYKAPGVAKRYGRETYLDKHELRHWDEIKVGVMRILVLQKAQDHEAFRVWLLSTGDTKLVEGNWWHDQFWGSCKCSRCFYRTGENHLGKILMDIRDDLA